MPCLRVSLIRTNNDAVIDPRWVVPFGRHRLLATFVHSLPDFATVGSRACSSLRVRFLLKRKDQCSAGRLKPTYFLKNGRRKPPSPPPDPAAAAELPVNARRREASGRKRAWSSPGWEGVIFWPAPVDRLTMTKPSCPAALVPDRSTFPVRESKSSTRTPAG